MARLLQLLRWSTRPACWRVSQILSALVLAVLLFSWGFAASGAAAAGSGGGAGLPGEARVGQWVCPALVTEEVRTIRP